jgi:2-keto-4-pentenoate hydratase/2-oxohepta-3-ene-1,7-dioic acid hydratase in catechol pathway
MYRGVIEMKLVRYCKKSIDSEQLGLSTEVGLIQLQPLAQEVGVNVPSSMDEVLQHSEEELGRLRTLLNKVEAENIDLSKFVLSPESIRYLPVVKAPEKIICVGLNYMTHARELGGDIPIDPILFNKFNNSLAAHKQEIPIPTVTQQVDYEAELVVVISKQAHHISTQQASEYILGYTIGNDLSARDLQFKTSQWMIGKSLDYFAPIGPSIATKESIQNPNNLSISLTRNGEIVQESNTKELIFSVEYLVSYISQYMTLNPGDLIFTGTPSGVIAGKKGSDKQWLCATDEITVTIEGIGSLTNCLI